MLLGKKVSKASIAKILDVAPSTLYSFIQSRHLESRKRRRAGRIFLHRSGQYPDSIDFLAILHSVGFFGPALASARG
jgi:hypothetical protein